jgi:paraquat-inducible protein B
VGEVTGYELAKSSDHVRIYINVLPFYVPLLRESTKFWNASGLAVSISPFSGASIRTNSFESLIEGGIAFATPNNAEMGAHAREDGIYQLHNKPEPEWLNWKPTIELGK